MEKVYVVSAKRTAIGSFLGSLKSVSATDLGAEVLKNMIAETNLDVNSVDEVVVGNVLPAGAGQGPARQVSLKAGIPMDIPAYGISMVCGSGMKAVLNAYVSISGGFENIVIAGGIESMSNAPYLIPSNSRTGNKMGDFKCIDHMIFDALTDAYSNVHMGITAENIAKKFNISKEEQDQFALNSQTKAINAIDSGKFKGEIVPVLVKQKREVVTFDTDEFPNRTTNLEKLNKLKPCFVKENGSVTAGTSSGINDGAAFLLLASESACKKYNLEPICEVVAIGQGGVDPQYMGLGPVPAIRNVLKNANLTLKDMDVIELNEAFAAQSLGVLKSLEEEHNVSMSEIMSKTNIYGGAIALGHPVGASGSRITVTLAHLLKNNDFKYGLASLCIGGGMGTAIVLKKYSK